MPVISGLRNGSKRIKARLNYTANFEALLDKRKKGEGRKNLFLFAFLQSRLLFFTMVPFKKSKVDTHHSV